MKKILIFAMLVFAIGLLFSCTSDFESAEEVLEQARSLSSSSGGNCPNSSIANGNVFIDQRDCNKYKFEIAPNGKIWMSENLNYSRNETLGYCYNVDMDEENPHQDGSGCNNGYGRIYEWVTAMDGNLPQGLCPDGWHIPNTTEWNNVIADEEATRKMSSVFYIYSGNYNLNLKYPPIGWKERGKNGFYWTSKDNASFVIFLGGDTPSPSEKLESTATGSDYFSVRCVADDNLIFYCNENQYYPVTEFCSGNEVYKKCNAKEYDPSTHFCSDDSKTLYEKCKTKEYDFSTQYCSNGTLEKYGTVKDNDGREYKTVVIGDQTWMAENLNYDPGTGISYCYNGQANNCTIYGRLYNWSTALGICPTGWRIPSRADWDELFFYVNNNIDNYGFSAQLGGYGRSGGYYFAGISGYWWTDTDIEIMNEAYYYPNNGDWNRSSKSDLYSVRCIQNPL